MEANIYVINGLKRKRGELAGQITVLQANLKALYADLAAIDRSLQMMDPAIVPAKIKAIRPRLRFKHFRSGELPRLILSHLRKATEPVPLYVLIDALMADKALDGSEKALRNAVEKRARAALQRMESKRIAKRLGMGREAQWLLAG